MFNLTFRKNLIHSLVIIGLFTIFLHGCGKDNEIKPLPIPVSESVTNDNGGDNVNSNGDFGNQPGLSLRPEDFGPENLLNGIPIIGIREEKDGMYQSYLTGKWKDTAVAKRRPFAIMIPNNKAAMPQYGISKASIIFEAPVEWGMTRLLAFVEDYDDLERIGPTRSARDYFMFEAMGKEAIFCNWGLTIVYCAPLLNSDRVDNVSNPLEGVDRGAAEAFKRFSRPNYSMEFTGYMVIDGYSKAVNRLGYNPNYSADFVPQFTFAAEYTQAEYVDYPDAKIIRPGGDSNNKSGYGDAKPSFEYNEDNRLYYRSQFGGKHIDEMNNEQLAYSNIVFQYTYGEVRDANDYLIFQMHENERPVKVFTNGKVIDGTWKRLSDGEPAKYYDKNGYEIVFNQGKTWICLIWDKYSEYAEHE